LTDANTRALLSDAAEATTVLVHFWNSILS
jgi:hypothetical protein